jgi:hypothetical protein
MESVVEKIQREVKDLLNKEGMTIMYGSMCNLIDNIYMNSYKTEDELVDIMEEAIYSFADDIPIEKLEKLEKLLRYRLI